jgi:hypothetical protein
MRALIKTCQKKKVCVDANDDTSKVLSVPKQMMMNASIGQELLLEY